MVIAALILIPMLSGSLAFFLADDRARRGLLVAVALAHFGLVGLVWRGWGAASTALAEASGAWLAIDATGLIFLSIVSTLFLAVSAYGVGYLARERRSAHVDVVEHLYFRNEPEAVFTGCLLLFLGSMTLVTVSQHFGLLWVGIEATTLASAPLIYFHRQHRSLEATWKYLLICSVGIALALMGNFLLAVATPGGSEDSGGLVLGNLTRGARSLDAPWLKGAFLFFLVGYGTKMGLAPLHTWLPDAHSESPSMASALLSGALLNCAFLGILRAYQVCLAAGQAAFCQDLLIGFGLFSMLMAAVFVLNQSDYKRMLAYSSVEHMGILALGVGLGSSGAFGSALHAVNHSLTKASLFLTAGNILGAYATKSIGDVKGVLRVLPASGVLWVAGMFSITGSPPFGMFLSEFTILKAGFDAGRGVVAAAYLGLLGIIFVGMSSLVLGMAQGEPAEPMAPRREKVWSILPPAALLLLSLAFGVYLPPTLRDALAEMSRSLGGR